MHPNWEHWRDLKGTCPVCGKPSHVGASMRTGRYYWLHDDYDIREYYREHRGGQPRLVRVRACRLAASNQVDGGCSKARKMRLRPSVFNGIDFVFAGDGNPRWRHLGFLVSGQAGNPAEKAWERVRRHPLFHAFSALALIEYQCSPAKAALRVARFGKRIYKVT